MSNYQDNIKRFILNEEEYRNLFSLIYCKLQYDKYEKYRICNIYFDTPSYSQMSEPLDMSIYNEKQISKVIRLIMNKYGLYPILFFSYDRVAMKGIDDENLRITFDTNIKWRVNDLGNSGNTQLAIGTYIMEVETKKSIPFWLKDALKKINIFPKFEKVGYEKVLT